MTGYQGIAPHRRARVLGPRWSTRMGAASATVARPSCGAKATTWWWPIPAPSTNAGGEDQYRA